MVLISIVLSHLSSNKLHSVHLSSLSVGVGRRTGLSLLLNFQKEGAWENLSPQISGSQKVVAGKDRGDFFQGGCSFYIKNKLKSEIFNDKKGLLTKLFLPLITKNLNWEILTKNLVTFKRWDGVKDEKC